MRDVDEDGKGGVGGMDLLVNKKAEMHFERSNGGEAEFNRLQELRKHKCDVDGCSKKEMEF